MGDPHNPDRYGETWNLARINSWSILFDRLAYLVVFSGGWAWHFMSAPGHVEYKHAHDHKDVDLMVPKPNVGAVVQILKDFGFEKVHTKYDRLPSAEDFRRYERADEGGKMTVDFFVKDVPFISLEGPWHVVSPDVLLTYYGEIHSSDKCWAVQAASRLLAAGETITGLVGNPLLSLSPDLPLYHCTKCGWQGQFPLERDICGGCLKYNAFKGPKPVYKPKAVADAEIKAWLESQG